MNDAPETGGDPANLKFLRLLVTVLTATMIVGLVIIVTLFVIRYRHATSPLAIPTHITLPQGAHALAYTQTADWLAVVTDTNEILIFDRTGKTLKQKITITP